MKHRAGLDRSQTLLFPERLEDYLAPENPVRFLDAFVGSLDLHALKFGKARCAATGCPPYDPASCSNFTSTAICTGCGLPGCSKPNVTATWK
jgi:hypothetical protein